jgi:hypothetical protein
MVTLRYRLAKGLPSNARLTETVVVKPPTSLSHRVFDEPFLMEPRHNRPNRCLSGDRGASDRGLQELLVDLIGIVSITVHKI